MEIFYLGDSLDRVEFLSSMPILFLIIHLILDLLKRHFLDLNKFFILLLGFMVALSLISFLVSVLTEKDHDFVALICFTANMIIFQKLVFIQVILYLLKVFDIGIIKLRNQMNSN